MLDTQAEQRNTMAHASSHSRFVWPSGVENFSPEAGSRIDHTLSAGPCLTRSAVVWAIHAKLSATAKA